MQNVFKCQQQEQVVLQVWLFNQSRKFQNRKSSAGWVSTSAMRGGFIYMGSGRGELTHARLAVALIQSFSLAWEPINSFQVSYPVIILTVELNLYSGKKLEKNMASADWCFLHNKPAPVPVEEISGHYLLFLSRWLVILCYLTIHECNDNLLGHRWLRICEKWLTLVWSERLDHTLMFSFFCNSLFCCINKSVIIFISLPRFYFCCFLLCIGLLKILEKYWPLLTKLQRLLTSTSRRVQSLQKTKRDWTSGYSDMGFFFLLSSLFFGHISETFQPMSAQNQLLETHLNPRCFKSSLNPHLSNPVYCDCPVTFLHKGQRPHTEQMREQEAELMLRSL